MANRRCLVAERSLTGTREDNATPPASVVVRENTFSLDDFFAVKTLCIGYAGGRDVTCPALYVEEAASHMLPRSFSKPGVRLAVRCG